MAFGLFKKKKEEESTKKSRYKNLKVKEIVPVAKDAVNVIFEKPEEFDYQPGQFITVIENINGQKLRRAYSLCTAPDLDDNPGITVKRVQNGSMSNHINDNFSVGKEVEIMEPMGLFTTEYDANNSRNVVLFGGGSGITPLYSILRTVLQKEPNSTVTLVYGNRSADYVIFKDELAQLNQENSNFNIIHILEEDPNNTSDYIGRPDSKMIVEICRKLDLKESSEIFVCGPQPMMDNVKEGLAAYKFPSEKIRLESFEAGVTSPQEIISDPNEVQQAEATIMLDDEKFAITIEKEKPILEQGLKQGLDMPYSCQSGLCTACRGKCIEGEVSVDKAEGLSESEIDEGYVLTCVGRALSDRVVIEIG